jgi:hypothetical protein
VSDVSRWRDSGHLERAVQTTGGQEAFNAAVSAMLDNARGWRLAEMRKRRAAAARAAAAPHWHLAVLHAETEDVDRYLPADFETRLSRAWAWRCGGT